MRIFDRQERFAVFVSGIGVKWAGQSTNQIVSGAAVILGIFVAAVVVYLAVVRSR